MSTSHHLNIFPHLDLVWQTSTLTTSTFVRFTQDEVYFLCRCLCSSCICPTTASQPFNFDWSCSVHPIGLDWCRSADYTIHPHRRCPINNSLHPDWCGPIYHNQMYPCRVHEPSLGAKLSLHHHQHKASEHHEVCACRVHQPRL